MSFFNFAENTIGMRSQIAIWKENYFNFFPSTMTYGHLNNMEY